MYIYVCVCIYIYCIYAYVYVYAQQVIEKNTVLNTYQGPLSHRNVWERWKTHTQTPALCVTVGMRIWGNL